ncbi:MAG: ABC transporter ATP-binding protein [Acidobacteriaceae bacterium]
MPAPTIATHALTRRYGSTVALRDVTLTVEPGSVYALVGPNGAGKTTLIQLLMNLQPSTSGSAEVLGMPSQSIRGAALNRIGYISESQELPDWMTVGEFLDYLRQFYPGWDAGLERQLLRDFALPLDRKLKHMSRGMRMKAAFISALSYRPALLVLDEPFSGLDPLVRDELIEGLLDRIGETTLFLSSHDLAEIESFASHVGYLEQGQLLFSEEMTALSGRFRKVEFQVDPASGSPPKLPEAWMEVERSGSLVRFTHSAFTSEGEARAQIETFFPTAANPEFAPLSLRSIFLANARAHLAGKAQVDSGIAAVSTQGGRA